MSNVPANLKYSKDHEWAKIEGEVATIGITAFAAEQLGDVVYVDLPKVGDALKAGSTFGVVESTKAVSDLFAPLSGKVLEINGPVVDNPGTLNSDPYEKGWLVRIQLSASGEVKELLDAAGYTAHMASSAH